MSRASSVGIDTRLRVIQPGNRGSFPSRGKRLFSRSALEPNQPPTRELGGRGMELTTHNHLMPTLRRTGAASPKATCLNSVHKAKLLSNPVNIAYMRRDSLLTRSRKNRKRSFMEPLCTDLVHHFYIGKKINSQWQQRREIKKKNPLQE